MKKEYRISRAINGNSGRACLRVEAWTDTGAGFKKAAGALDFYDEMKLSDFLSSRLGNDYELWRGFYIGSENGPRLSAFTIFGSFPGETSAVKEAIAEEYGVKLEEIKSYLYAAEI